MGTALELLRPPAHRGPLIASGAVLVTVGIALEELRLADKLATGWHLAILAPAGAAMLALAVQVRTHGGAPPAFQSVLLVCALLLTPAALLTLSDVLGAEFDGNFPAGALVWTSLIWAGLALWPATTKRSSICALIAVLAIAIAGLAFVKWVFDADSVTTYRWLLLVLALAYVVVSLLLRGPAPRHSEQLVNAAGLAILALAMTGLLRGLLGVFSSLGGSGGPLLPNGWELVVLAAGCGLVAYGAVDRAPGPAYLGVANLLAFIVVGGVNAADTLLYWPMMLLVLGIGAMAVGLRPRSPLPPEPDAYPAGTVPLASRTGDRADTVLRVRDDSPPTR
jgi:hypothetical protein